MITAHLIEGGRRVIRTFRNGNDLWLHQQQTGCYVERYDGVEEPAEDTETEAA